MDFVTNLEANLTADSIRNILTHLGEKKKPTRKGEMVQRLQDIWQREPRRLLDALSAPERMLLAECAHTDSIFPDVARLNAKHGFSYSIPHSSGYRDVHVVLCFLARERNWDHELVDGVLDDLRRLLPAPPPLQIASLPDLPAEGTWTFPRWGGKENVCTRALQGYESERTAPVEAKRMLQLVSADKLRVSDKTGLPTPATQRAVSEALCAPEMDLVLPKGEHRLWRESDRDPGPVRAFAWPVLLQQCGWTKPKAGNLTLTRKGKALLDAFTFEGYAEGVQHLLSDTAFDELRRVRVLKGQSGRRSGRGRVPLETRRNGIFNCLSALPRNRWVTIEEAHRALLALGENGYAYAEGMCLYIHEFQYGHLSGRETDIGRIYFRQLLGESLATLGLVDLGYGYPHYLHPELDGSWGLDDEVYVTRFDGVKYLRPTPLGRFCLGVDDTYAPPEVEQRALFKVLPNLEIVVTNPVSFSVADAAMIECFAKRKSDSVWKIDRKTVLGALEAGDTPEHILGVLQSGTHVDIPVTVRDLVADTAVRAGAATGRHDAIIVEFRDEETAALVAHDTTASKAILCREHTSVVVYRKKAKAFQNALRKLGILLP